MAQLIEARRATTKSGEWVTRNTVAASCWLRCVMQATNALACTPWTKLATSSLPKAATSTTVQSAGSQMTQPDHRKKSFSCTLAQPSNVRLIKKRHRDGRCLQ